jgi:hypothetical protein
VYILSETVHSLESPGWTDRKPSDKTRADSHGHDARS